MGDRIMPQPLVWLSPHVHLGAKTTLTVDIQVVPGQTWPYPEPEYRVYLQVIAWPLFEQLDKNDAAEHGLVLGLNGTHGPAVFELKAHQQDEGFIQINFINQSGLRLMHTEHAVLVD